MQSTDDPALLRQYTENRSDDAFAGLVARHINLVYSVAMRQVGDPRQAEEITQEVFIILARKAPQLRHGQALSSWLFQTTRLTAHNFVRRQLRRQHREQEAHMQSHWNEPDDIWPQIAPLLDAAVAALGDQDRRAIVARFYEGRNLREVGLALGASEDAAEKRVSRAVEKLRQFFNRRGVVLPVAILTAAISANSVQAAPVALATSVATAALAQGVAASSTFSLTKGALKIMAWTKAKIAMIAGASVLLAVGTTAVIIHDRNQPILGIPPGWSVLSGATDQWHWTNNAICAHSDSGETMLASSRKYGDVTLSAILGSTNRDAELVLHMVDAQNGYHILYIPDDTPWAAENGSTVKLVRNVNGNETDLAEFKRRGLPHFAKITARVRGPSIEVLMDDASIMKVKDFSFPLGYIGLRAYGDPVKPGDATFSNLIIH